MDTMNPIKAMARITLFMIALLGASSLVSAQAIRFETTAQTTNAQCQAGSLCPVLAVPGATVQVCKDAGCSVPATTFTDVTASTQCPAYAQLTLPGSFSCTNASDAQGNIGFWIGQGTFYYTITFPVAAGGGTKGPFALTAGAAGILAAGTDTQVQYNKQAQFGADGNLTWVYASGILNIQTLANGVTGLNLNTTGAGTLSGISLSDHGIAKWQIFETSSDSSLRIHDSVAGVDIFTVGSGPGQNIQFNATSGAVIFNGSADTPSIITLNGSFIQTSGGLLSAVVGGSWNAIQSLSDGSLMRGYGVAPNQINTAGGYIDMAPITYNPNGGGSCTDANGNPVQQPSPLPGLSAFGSTDTIMWVTQSPQMPPGGSCGAILPVNEDWGLAINSYLFARGGLATDNGKYNAINTIYLGGGVPAGGLTAGAAYMGTLYPAGTVTTTGTLSVPTYLGGYIGVGFSNGVPTTGTIATAVNPFISGGGLEPGLLYYDSGLSCFNGYSGTAWACLGTGGGGSGTITASPQFQIPFYSASGTAQTLTGASLLTYDAGQVTLAGATSFFIATGASAGFNASACTLTNCLQAALGGVEGKYIIASDSHFWIEEAAPAASVAGQAKIYSDSTLHWPQLSSNASSYLPLAVTGAFSGFTSGHCVSTNISSGVLSLVDAGGACTTGGGGGTVASSSVNQVAIYTAATVVTGNAGLTFNATTGILVVSGGSSPGINMTSTSLSATGILQLSGASSNVDVTTATAYNAIQAPSGGIGNILSGTFVNYVQPGSYSTTIGSGPPLSTSDIFHAGALSYYSGSSGGGPCLVMFGGSTWACLSGGGGSGTVTSALQNQVAVYPANGATVQGYSTFTYNSSTTTLSVTGTGIITTGAFNSSATGTSTAIIVNSGTFGVLGNGSVSAAGVIASNGGGLNVTAQNSASSIQTTGGVNACNASGCTGGSAFSVAGSTIVSSTLAATFSTVTASSYLQSTVSTSANAIVVNSGAGGTFIVNGLGAVSAAGIFNSTGASGGMEVSTNTAANSIQTIGGFNACFSGSCVSGIAYEVAGTKLIDSSLNAFVHNITISGTCTGCSSASVSSITGTANQVLANGTSGSAQTGAITLTTAQNIGTGNSPTFAGMTINGALGVTGVVTTTGGGGGFNVTGNTASNSIQTVGGNLSALGYNTGASGVYDVNNTTVINSSGQFVGAAVLATGNVSAGGTFAIAGGFFGQNHTVVIGGCSMFFQGGILYATSGC